MSTRKAIYVEAARLFRDKGYPKTSVRDIAHAVGIEAGSLYNHIKGKEDLLKEICFNHAQDFIAGIHQIDQEDMSALDKISRVLEMHIEIAVDQPSSITVFNDEWRYLSSPHIESFLQLRHEYEEILSSLIKKGIDEGALRRIPVDLVRNTLLSALRWVYYWNPERSVFNKEQLRNELLNILVTGIKVT